MRKSLLLMVLAVMLLALSGLVAAQDEVTIRLAGWSSSEEEDEALRAQVAAFEEANPGINVDLNFSPDYLTTMQTAFASGDYPEVFYIDSSQLPNWVEAGVVAPAEGNIEDVEGFYPSLLNVFTYNDTLYCPPKDFSTMTLQYNRELFDAAGVEYPTADWTWDDLRAAAEQLTGTNEAGEQVLGLVTPPNFERWLPFFYQAGGQLFTEDGMLNLNSEAGQQAIDLYVGMVNDGIAGPPSAVDAGWGGEAFANGRVAMAMEGNWVINYLNEQFPDLDWSVAPLPAGPGGEEASMAFTVCYGVAADNEHPEESWALVNFLTGEGGAQEIAETSFGVMPPRASAADAWLARFGEEMQPFLDAADNAYPWVLPVGFQDFVDTFNDYLQQAFTGNVFPEDVLTEAQSVGEEILAR